MSLSTDTRTTPRERLARGLKYSAVGPVEVTLGVVGLGAQTARSAACGLRSRYRSGQLREELAAAQEALVHELAAAQEVVANLPQTLQAARRPKRRRRTLLFAAIGVVALAGGAVAFSIVRRSTQPDPSPLPPSVEVEPRP
ncbi:MAG: cell wall synthesis protein CwsA [Actinobacteria bacterium]|nr:cell wall synthesis protein CwsA [Actinomycetota bacterium]